MAPWSGTGIHPSRAYSYVSTIWDSHIWDNDVIDIIAFRKLTFGIKTESLFKIHCSAGVLMNDVMQPGKEGILTCLSGLEKGAFCMTRGFKFGSTIHNTKA